MINAINNMFSHWSMICVAAVRRNAFREMFLSVFFPAVLFSSLLVAENPQFNFYGDLAILYFPQFVEAYHLAKAGALVGVDFLTSNGASAYFLRPNIPAYYPPYQIVFTVFNLDSIEQLARAFVWILFAHSVVAAYFCIKIGRSFFRMTPGVALLFSILYFGAIASEAMAEPPFYFAASLFPLVLYSALRSASAMNWGQRFILSAPYVIIFLAGYVPLDVNAVLAAIIFAVIFFWQINPVVGIPFRIVLIRIICPIMLGGLVVLPLYLSMASYHALVSGVPEGVWSSAHQMALEAQDFFAFFSRAFPAKNPGVGAPYVRLGILPFAVLMLAFSQRQKLPIALADGKLMSLALIFFAFYLLLAFGPLSGLPDLFYFVVPVIGKMHFYGRYLLVASFFYFVVVAIAFKYVIDLRHELPLGRCFAATISVIFVVGLLGQSFFQKTFDVNHLVVELLMVCMLFAALASRQSVYVLVGAIGLMFFVSAANFSAFTNTFSVGAPGPYFNDVAFSKERRDDLVKYLKLNSTKYLVKYADITSGIEKKNGLMLNFPWLIQDKFALSNYMGYEPHMAIDREFMEASPHPYYGKLNLQLLLKTGADFLIFDDASWKIYSDILSPWLDRSVPEFDLRYGYKVAKLKDASGLVEYLPARVPGDFDNGIIRARGSAGAVRVSGFQTNLVSRIYFEIESDVPAKVQYLLFPNKLMALTVDGSPADARVKGGVLEFSVLPGLHRVEYRYSNPLHRVFTVGVRLYLILLSAVLICFAIRALRTTHFKSLYLKA